MSLAGVGCKRKTKKEEKAVIFSGRGVEGCGRTG
jgi:hypothetical protein